MRLTIAYTTYQNMLNAYPECVTYVESVKDEYVRADFSLALEVLEVIINDAELGTTVTVTIPDALLEQLGTTHPLPDDGHKILLCVQKVCRSLL